MGSRRSRREPEVRYNFNFNYMMPAAAPFMGGTGIGDVMSPGMNVPGMCPMPGCNPVGDPTFDPVFVGAGAGAGVSGPFFGGPFFGFSPFFRQPFFPFPFFPFLFPFI